MDTDYGALYGAYRPAAPGERYWRLAMFLFPFWTMIPTGVLGHQVLARAWVPVDDEHTMFFEVAPREYIAGRQGPGLELLPNTSDWYGRWRLVSRQENDYRINRDKQRRGEEYTGIAGVPTQDQAITESMGAIYDRSTEHLGSSDVMVIRVRRRLMEAVRALADHGEEPYSALHPEAFRQRSGGIFLPDDADWLADTAALRQAYVTHPNVDPSLAGRV